MEVGQGMSDDSSDPVVVVCVWPSALLLNAIALPVKTLS